MKTTLDFNQFTEFRGVNHIYNEIWSGELVERVSLEYIDWEKPVMDILKITKKQFAQYGDDIKSEVINACEAALIDSYSGELYSYLKNAIRKQLLEDTPFISKVEFKTVEDTSKESISGYKTVVECTINQNKAYKIIAEQEGLTLKEAKENCYIKDYVNVEQVNTEYFDYYGTVGDYDNWPEYFKQNEGVSYLIEQDIKKKNKKIKALMLNKVQLEKRQSILQS